MIALKDCKDGYLYRIDARNAGLGIFWKAEKSFIILRHKFFDKFLDTEGHWDTGSPYGSAKCLEELEKYLDEIPVDFMTTNNKEQVEKWRDTFRYMQEKEKEYGD